LNNSLELLATQLKPQVPQSRRLYRRRGSCCRGRCEVGRAVAGALRAVTEPKIEIWVKPRDRDGVRVGEASLIPISQCSHCSATWSFGPLLPLANS